MDMKLQSQLTPEFGIYLTSSEGAYEFELMKQWLTEPMCDLLKISACLNCSSWFSRHNSPSICYCSRECRLDMLDQHLPGEAERKRFENRARKYGYKVDFPSLWNDFLRLAARAPRVEEPVRYTPGYKKRFERLRQAMTELDEMDLHALESVVSGLDQGCDQFMSKLQICKETTHYFSEIKNASNKLSMTSLNPGGGWKGTGKPLKNHPLERVIYLYQKYIDVEFKVSNDSLTADLSQLFLTSSGNDPRGDYKAISRQLKNIRDHLIENPEAIRLAAQASLAVSNCFCKGNATL